MVYKYVGFALCRRSTLASLKSALKAANSQRCRAIWTASSSLQQTKEAFSSAAPSKHAQAIENVLKSHMEDLRMPNYEIVLEPYYNICAAASKSIYPDFVDSLNYWMNVSEDKVQFCWELCDELYQQLTLQDDIIDDSDIRYGQPSTHRIFGHQRTWVSSVSSLVLIVQKLHALDNPKALQLFCENYLTFMNSVSYEMDQTNFATCPTVEGAMKSGIQKTAPYLSTIIEVMRCFSECKKDFTKLSALLALYLQILNDRNNLSRDKQVFLNDKSFAEDLSQGHFSLPVVFATQKQSPESKKLLNLMRLKTRDADLKHLGVDLIEQLGGIDETKALEAEARKLLLEEIDELGGNPLLVSTIDKTHRWQNDKIVPGSPMYNDNE